MISVCMATYNGEKYIKQQLLSILPQIGEHDEVIISDDGSTDKTIDIVRSVNDKRIKIVNGPCKGSPTYNFENALKISKGDYIFLSDQDDVWNERKVAICMDYLKRYACIVSDCNVTNSKGEITHTSFFELLNVKSNKYYNLLIKNAYIGCCMAFRREVLAKALPFPGNIPLHDIWIGNIAAFKYSLAFIPEPLVRFRRHENTESTTTQESRYSLTEKICFRVNLLINLFKRI